MWTSMGMGAEGCACALLWSSSRLQEVRSMRNTRNQCNVKMRSHAPSEPWLDSNLFVTLPDVIDLSDVRQSSRGRGARQAACRRPADGFPNHGVRRRRAPRLPRTSARRQRTTTTNRGDHALYATCDIGALARFTRDGQSFVRRNGELVIRRDAQHIRL